MEFLRYVANNDEWFRGNEIASKNIEAPNRGETDLVSHVQTSIKTDSPETDRAPDEREVKLELWMEEVKSFIRNIDINNL